MVVVASALIHGSRYRTVAMTVVSYFRPRSKKINYSSGLPAKVRSTLERCEPREKTHIREGEFIIIGSIEVC